MDKWMDVIVTEYFSKKMGKVILNANDFVGTIYRNSGGMFAQQKKGVPYSNSGIFSSSVLIYPRAT